MADAALHFSYIGRLHRVPGAAPAAGSCDNASAGNHSGNSGREARLDYRAMDTVALHLHSIAAADPWYYSNSKSRSTAVEVRVEKKIKKDLTSRITWDIKGVLTRKTKG